MKSKKTINIGKKFPANSLKESISKLEILEEGCGGKGQIDDFASSLSMSTTSSNFEQLISSLKQYKLIEKVDKIFNKTKLAKNILFPIDDGSKIRQLRIAFNNSNIFAGVYHRIGQISNLTEKKIKNLLISEFDISSSRKSVERAVKSFIDSGIFCELLYADKDGNLNINDVESLETETFEVIDLKKQENDTLQVQNSSEKSLETSGGQSSFDIEHNVVQGKNKFVKIELSFNIDINSNPELLRENLRLIKEFLEDLT